MLKPWKICRKEIFTQNKKRKFEVSPHTHPFILTHVHTFTRAHFHTHTRVCADTFILTHKVAAA